MNLLSQDTIDRISSLAERWNTTKVWHDYHGLPFLDGEIHITTGDLKAIAQLHSAIFNKPKQKYTCKSCGSEFSYDGLSPLVEFCPQCGGN